MFIIRKLVGNGSVTIAQKGNLGTYEVSRKRNFAMINKINKRFWIFWDSMFNMVEYYSYLESIIFCLEYGMYEFSSEGNFLKING